MKTTRRLIPALGALAFATVLVPSTVAQCGVPAKLAKPSGWHPQFGNVHLVRTAEDGDEDAPSIVGMWHVVFTAHTMNGESIPDPGVGVDNALVVWHSDRTEIMNSVRPPQDGNFCLGVWEQTGRYEYHLNHYAWFSNAFPTNPPTEIGPATGPTRFVEEVTVSPDGKSYSGTFTLTAYNSNFSVNTTFTGTLSATRITTHTKIEDLE